MANTSHQSMVLEGGNYAVIIPATLTDGEISAVGTPIKHEALESAEYELAAGSDSEETITKLMDNGVTVEAPAVTKVLSAVTGAEKNASGDRDKIRFTTLEVDQAAMAELQALIGDPCFVCIPTGDGDGFAFVYGKLSGTLTKSTKGNELQVLPVEFTGTEGVTDGTFAESNLNTAFTMTVEPMGEGATVDIFKSTPTTNHFTSADLTDLLTGKIVLKPVA